MGGTTSARRGVMGGYPQNLTVVVLLIREDQRSHRQPAQVGCVDFYLRADRARKARRDFTIM